MTPSSPVFRVASTTASAAVLAITVGLFPAGPAAADSEEPAPASTTSPDQCLLVCWSGPTEDPETAGPTRTRKPKDPESPPAPPAEPVPAPPVQPAPSDTPAAGTDPVPAQPVAEPEDTAAGPSAAATATGSAGSPPPTGASSGQDWNTPVTRSARASRVAAVTPGRDPGSGGPALLPIIAGVLLLGAAGASFIWWGRSRFRAGAH
jgi:outer membrane biosynthesis protein TonB